MIFLQSRGEMKRNAEYMWKIQCFAHSPLVLIAFGSYTHPCMHTHKCTPLSCPHIVLRILEGLLVLGCPSKLSLSTVSQRVYGRKRLKVSCEGEKKGNWVTWHFSHLPLLLLSLKMRCPPLPRLTAMPVPSSHSHPTRGPVPSMASFPGWPSIFHSPPKLPLHIKTFT